MESKNIIIVIQARMGSSRFPEKVMAPILDKPLIWHMVKRLKKIPSISNIIIATTKEKEDKKLIKFAQSEEILIEAGEVNDIIDRIYQATKKFKPTAIVKINGDCPLVDPTLIEEGIQIYLNSPDKLDLVTNALDDTFPEGMQYGIFNFTTLERLWKNMKEPFWREYFFRYIIEHKDKFKTIGIRNESNLSSLRWTVDYKEDLEFVKKIFESLYKNNNYFTMKEILEYLEENPELTKINNKFSSQIGINEFNEFRKKSVKD